MLKPGMHAYMAKDMVVMYITCVLLCRRSQGGDVVHQSERCGFF
jgi:hypothetical protein